MLMLEGKERCEELCMLVSHPLRPPFRRVLLLVTAGVARRPRLTALGSLSSQQLLVRDGFSGNTNLEEGGHFIPGVPLTTRPVGKNSPLHILGGGYRGTSNSSLGVPGLTEYQWSIMAAGSITHS